MHILSILKIINDIKLLLCVSYNNNQEHQLFLIFRFLDLSRVCIYIWLHNVNRDYIYKLSLKYH